MELTITFYFLPTSKWFTVKSDFIEASIHAGLKAWGRSKEAAIVNLTKKWNKKVDEDEVQLKKNITNYKLVEVVLTPFILKQTSPNE